MAAFPVSVSRRQRPLPLILPLNQTESPGAGLANTGAPDFK
jgi:hypothetical protein